MALLDDFSVEFDLAFKDERLDVAAIDAAKQGHDLDARFIFSLPQRLLETNLRGAQILDHALRYAAETGRCTVPDDLDGPVIVLARDNDAHFTRSKINRTD